MSAAARWRALTQALGLDPDAAAPARWGARFLAAYAEPHRAYHGTAHLEALLARIEAWAARADDPAALTLAAFAHDAVYQGRPGRDEAESAALAEACGDELGLSPERIGRISRWVRATAGHAPQQENDAALFLDADLEILAAEPGAYDLYAAAIRREYAKIDESAFRAGRRAALIGFLDRPAIYGHPLTPKDWERAARENIARELAAL